MSTWNNAQSIYNTLGVFYFIKKLLFIYIFFAIKQTWHSVFSVELIFVSVSNILTVPDTSQSFIFPYSSDFDTAGKKSLAYYFLNNLYFLEEPNWLHYHVTHGFNLNFKNMWINYPVSLIPSSWQPPFFCLLFKCLTMLDTSHK